MEKVTKYAAIDLVYENLPNSYSSNDLVKNGVTMSGITVVTRLKIT
jgi:hypothetical protein